MLLLDPPGVTSAPSALEITFEVLRANRRLTLPRLIDELNRRWVVVPGIDLDTFVNRLLEQGLLRFDASSQNVDIANRLPDPNRGSYGVSSRPE